MEKVDKAGHGHRCGLRHKHECGHDGNLLSSEVHVPFEGSVNSEGYIYIFRTVKMLWSGAAGILECPRLLHDEGFV